MEGTELDPDFSHGDTTTGADDVGRGTEYTRTREDESLDLEQGQHHHHPPAPASPRAPYPTHSHPSLRSPPSPPAAATSHHTHTPSPSPSPSPDLADNYAWGPSHPCFPHPNPHVPLSSPLYTSTRIIRIKRDWLQAGDQAPAFSNLYPEILDPVLPEGDFRALVAHVNAELLRAFDPWTWRNGVDALLGLLTGWVWEDAGWTGIKGRLRGVEKWLEEWNARVGGGEGEGEREGVRVVGLRRTGYLTVSLFLLSFFVLIFEFVVLTLALVRLGRRG